MIVKIYRYKISAEKWDDFLVLQKKADGLYRKHVACDVQFVRNLADPQRVTEIHTYASEEIADKANGLHKAEPELSKLYQQFLACLDSQEKNVVEEIGEIQPSISSVGATLFVILLCKVPDRELPKEAILRHVEHLRNLDRAGRLVLCGPFTDDPSGMVVVRAKDKTEATALAESDPFVREGFRTFEVRSWLIANAANNFLS